MGPIRQIGGSFAPPITAEVLADYKSQLELAPGPESTKGAINDLILMLETFLETPESSEPKQPGNVGVGYIQMLEDEEIKRIWDVVPWDYEIDSMCKLFERLEAADPLRKIAYHLVWYARELTSDRQPVTKDKL